MDIYEIIFDKLSNEGFDIYPPATKVGECTSPYLVLKLGGSSTHSSFSTNIAYYDVLIYTPKNQYSKLNSIILKVRGCMKELYPLLKDTGITTPSFYDDTYKAHMSSIQYKAYQKR